ncbi:MAG: hypothetical protein AAFY42_06675 [Pseudomonadota bacterium]
MNSSQPKLSKAAFMRGASAFALCSAIISLGVAPTIVSAQQQNPETFSLPTATPTPTPAPQGPADERVGVPIGPRVIPQQQASPPTAAPASTPTPTSTPAATASETVSEVQTRPASTTRAPTQRPSSQTTAPQSAQTASEPATPSVRPDVRNANARGAGIGVDDSAAPGFESLDEEMEGTAPRSPDGWYSVDEAGSEAGATTASGPVPAPPVSSGTSTIWERASSQAWLLATLLLLTLALAGIIRVIVLRRKQEADATLQAPASVLTAGIRASMKEEATTDASRTLGEEFGEDEADDEVADEAETTSPPVSSEPENEVKRDPSPVLSSPLPPPANPSPIASPSPVAASPMATTTTAVPAQPLQLDLSLDIISASRSLMRLSVEFSLEVVNRSDTPVKDLNIAGELSSAKKGATGPAAIDKTQGLTTIERIAPQQSRRVKGVLQLPVSELSTISQNGKPVLIPLIHLRLGTLEHPAIKRTFVLGTPSASSLTRVHPLLMDGPPGGLPRLRAQLIKQA